MIFEVELSKYFGLGLIQRAESFFLKALKTPYLISEAKYFHSGKGHVCYSCGDISKLEN